MHRLNQRRFALAFAVLLVAGCSGPALQAPAEPAQARETLSAALDAWQRGDAIESVRTGSPAIQVTERDWAAGMRLVRYQIVSDGVRAGTDMRYRVVLNLQSANGKSVRRQAAYMVGTSPALTIHREYDE